MPLPRDFIESLLAKELSKTKTNSETRTTSPSGLTPNQKRLRELFPIQEQIGVLRRTDVEKPCIHGEAHGGRHYKCGAPTTWRVQNIPYCSIHALFLLNEMLVAKGVLG